MGYTSTQNAAAAAKRIKDKRAEIELGLAKLADVNEVLLEHAQFADREPELLRQREDIKAAIYLGTRSERDLAEIDSAIDAFKKESAEHDAKFSGILSDAPLIKNGLDRKIQADKEELEDLLGKFPGILGEHIRSEIEDAGARYLEVSQALMVGFKRILALGFLEKALGTGLCLADPAQHRMLSLPSFPHLESVAGFGDANTLFESVNIASDLNWLNAEVDAEISRLNTAGVAPYLAAPLSGLVHHINDERSNKK